MPWIAEEKECSGIEAIEVLRKHRFVDRAVFTGGQPACGKSLLTAVLGSFEGVEIQKYNYTIEHICSLYFLNKIDDSTAISMIRMLADLDLYNMMQSRETNFRFSDCSSIFQNPGGWRYLRRLFQPGDAAAADRIKKEKPILHIMTHNVMLFSPPLFKAVGEGLRIVEVIRHPLYMLKQWYLYMDRYGADARDFTVCFNYEGHSLPFFARGWEEQYIGSNSMDKVIYSIDYLTRQVEQITQNFSLQQRAQVLVIPFEQFVLHPWPFVKQLEYVIGAKATTLTRRELKRQNVPRAMIAQGIPLPIYKQYGWEPPHRGVDERKEMALRRQYAAECATHKAMEVLDRLCAVYEDKHMKGIL